MTSNKRHPSNLKRSRYTTDESRPIKAPVTVLSEKDFQRLEGEHDIDLTAEQRKLIQQAIDDYLILQSHDWNSPNYREVGGRLKKLSASAAKLLKELRPLAHPSSDVESGCATEIFSQALLSGVREYDDRWVSNLVISVELIQRLADLTISRKSAEPTGRQKAAPQFYQLVLPLAEVFEENGKSAKSYKTEHNDSGWSPFVQFVQAIQELLPAAYRLPTSSVGPRCHEALTLLERWQLPFAWSGRGHLETRLTRSRRRKRP